MDPSLLVSRRGPVGFEGLSDAVGGFNLHPGLCTLWSGSPGGLVRYSFSPVNSRVYNFGWYGKCDRMRSRNALGRHQQHRFFWKFTRVRTAERATRVTPVCTSGRVLINFDTDRNGQSRMGECHRYRDGTSDFEVQLGR